MANQDEAKGLFADRHLPLANFKLNGQTTAVWFVDQKSNILYFAKTSEDMNRIDLLEAKLSK